MFKLFKRKSKKEISPELNRTLKLNSWNYNGEKAQRKVFVRENEIIQISAFENGEYSLFYTNIDRNGNINILETMTYYNKSNNLNKVIEEAFEFAKKKLKCNFI